MGGFPSQGNAASNHFERDMDGQGFDALGIFKMLDMRPSVVYRKNNQFK